MTTHGIQTSWDTIEFPPAIVGAVARSRARDRESISTVGEAVEHILHVVLASSVAIGILVIGLDAAAGL